MRRLISVLALVGIITFISQVLWIVGSSIYWIPLRILIILVFAFLYLKWPRSEIGITRGSYSLKKLVLMGGLAGIGLYLFVGLNSFLDVLGLFGEPVPLSHISLSYIYLSILTGVILAPLMEELYSRGFLCALLKNWYTTDVIIIAVATAVTFSLSHFPFLHPSGQALIFILLIIPAAAGFAFLFLETGSLVPPLVAHAVINLLDLCVNISYGYSTQYGTIFLVIVLLVSCVALVANKELLLKMKEACTGKMAVITGAALGCLLAGWSFFCSYGGLFVQWKIGVLIGWEKPSFPMLIVALHAIGLILVVVSFLYLVFKKQQEKN